MCKTKDGVIDVNMDDEVIRGLTVIKDGEITWPPPPPKPAAPRRRPSPRPRPCRRRRRRRGHGGSGGPMPPASCRVFGGVGRRVRADRAYAPAAFLAHFTVFVLACFVGYMVVWNVTPALHTPLMSVTNAISSIIVIGALLQIAPPLDGTMSHRQVWIRWLAIVGIALTTINIAGGFAVTRRMLEMFRK